MNSLTITVVVFRFGILSMITDLASADCMPMTVENAKLGRYDISAEGCKHCDAENVLQVCENGFWSAKPCLGGCEITTKCKNVCKS